MSIRESAPVQHRETGAVAAFIGVGRLGTAVTTDSAGPAAPKDSEGLVTNGQWLSTRRALLPLTLGLALLLGACGGSSNSNPTTAPTTASKATAASGSAGSGATTAAATPAGGTGVTAAFCSAWPALATQSAALAGGPTAATKASFDQTAAYLKSLADTAPAEIKPDFQIFAQFWTTYIDIMAKANYDFAKASTDPTLLAALQGLSDPKLQQAATNISNWAQKNCTAAGR